MRMQAVVNLDGFRYEVEFEAVGCRASANTFEGFTAQNVKAFDLADGFEVDSPNGIEHAIESDRGILEQVAEAYRDNQAHDAFDAGRR